MSKVSRLRKEVKVLLKDSWKCPRCKGRKHLSTSCPEYLCLHIICLKCKYHEATHPLNTTPKGYVDKKVGDV